jgi:hypothetical protein
VEELLLIFAGESYLAWIPGRRLSAIPVVDLSSGSKPNSDRGHVVRSEASDVHLETPSDTAPESGECWAYLSGDQGHSDVQFIIERDQIRVAPYHPFHELICGISTISAELGV